ncbi:hypothetical protein L6164_036078 [Bauhinia variegata]|uniref:Uncharacterized protein n=1 Tax=Bauhinia variegata TaxID=167791 RepID=A0ACB9KG12_BAUVA|nr:hypothetical protein L6164_036078 [Bauhinia variegata]
MEFAKRIGQGNWAEESAYGYCKRPKATEPLNPKPCCSRKKKISSPRYITDKSSDYGTKHGMKNIVNIAAKATAADLNSRISRTGS